MADYIEGRDLDMAALLAEEPRRTELAIFTVHNKDLGRLAGLDQLPLTSLGLRWLSAPDLTQVPLPPGLQSLAIWHCSKLRSLDGIEQARGLKQLVLEDNAPLENAGALAELTCLTELSIQGGFTAQQKITSLAGIAKLPIEKLTLRAIAGGELDLSPVASLKKLKELDLHGPNFAREALAKVCAAHPWFYESLKDLKNYSLEGMRCKKCGGKQKEMFLRRGKYLMCPVCDKAAIERALAGFDQLVEAAR